MAPPPKRPITAPSALFDSRRRTSRLPMASRGTTIGPPAAARTRYFSPTDCTAPCNVVAGLTTLIRPPSTSKPSPATSERVVIRTQLPGATSACSLASACAGDASASDTATHVHGHAHRVRFPQPSTASPRSSARPGRRHVRCERQCATSPASYRTVSTPHQWGIRPPAECRRLYLYDERTRPRQTDRDGEITVTRVLVGC